MAATHLFCGIWSLIALLYARSVRGQSSTTSTTSSTHSTQSPTSTGTKDGMGKSQAQMYFANYYFFIIAIVAVIFLVMVFFIRRAKRKQRGRIFGDTQTALQHNLYNPTRMSAGERIALEQPPVRVEGLDERGEAPPPYKHRGEANGNAENGTVNPQVEAPPSVYFRNGPQPKPPIYSEREVSEGETSPTATSPADEDRDLERNDAVSDSAMRYF